MKAENKAKLTKSVVDKATYQGIGGKRFVIWDTKTPGFGLRVYPCALLDQSHSFVL